MVEAGKLVVYRYFEYLGSFVGYVRSCLIAFRDTCGRSLVSREKQSDLKNTLVQGWSVLRKCEKALDSGMPQVEEA